MGDIYITDLIEKPMLQNIQNAFSSMFGVSALITDAEGKPVTECSGGTDFCMKYTRACEKGRERCEKCDRLGAAAAIHTGKASIYPCHAGLMDCAAPIVIEGQMIGSFVAGQVLTEPPRKDWVKMLAKNMGIDEDAYYDAIQNVPIVTSEDLQMMAEYLFKTAELFSDIAKGRYQALDATKQAEQVANMKTDFLANMSHEIRTPMNAVIGMAEMALREEISQTARDCLVQIKNSSNALLTIINDILDFSKIESGKMDINPVEYEPCALFSEVVNIIMTRLKDKDVELILTVNPNMPTQLYGDNIRVRQVLINLANNAAKFTKKGKVHIRADYEPIDQDTIMLKVSVEDTGIGIKQRDLENIFQSFQQVDSKRNRNVEGTGLGLAISKQLVNLMGGELEVTSEYEKGSTFSFHFPQMVKNWNASMHVENATQKAAIGYFTNRHLAKEFFRELKRLNVMDIALASPDDLSDALGSYEEELKGRDLFLFVDELSCDEAFDDLLRRYPHITCIEMIKFYSSKKSDRANVRMIQKPLSTMHIVMALNGKEVHVSKGNDTFVFDFIAPDAEVLIVDDNEINLKVAEGLLEPLQMKITCAESGKAALDLIAQKRYDIIFMDHMMPGLDGVETTRIIRRLHPKYNDVPIIALTANAVGDMKDKFFEEGMNDFVAKPIELQTMVNTIKNWLPKDKILHVSEGMKLSAKDMKRDIIIGDLDVQTALEFIGNEKLYFGVLKEYYRTIPTKSVKIKDLLTRGDIKGYTIEVHALKSASRQIGAMKLSEMAAGLEQAGNDNDLATLARCTDEVLIKYVNYIDVLKPFCEDGENVVAKKNKANKTTVLALLEHLSEAVDNLDMDKMEEVISKLDEYEYGEEQETFFEPLKVAVENIDVDTVEEIIEKWREKL